MKKAYKEKMEDVSNLETIDDVQDVPMETIVPAPTLTREQLLKQSVDRLLQFYCAMQTNKDDFQEDELDAFEEMAMEYIRVLFPKLNTDEKAKKYLDIYVEIYKLQQTKHRRDTLLEAYSDVVQFCEQEEMVLDCSNELTKGIEEMSRRLDQHAHASSSKPKQVPTKRRGPSVGRRR